MGTMEKKSDATLQRDVVEEFCWDTRVGGAEIGVAVKDGVVALTGNVDSWARRVAAQEAAHRVSGVLDVVNDIEVVPHGTVHHDDVELASRVRLALQWDVMVPDEKIRTTVEHGRVSLEGEVEKWSQREDAERAVRQLSGVRSISNFILVKATKVQATELRRHVREALVRHATREAERIKIEVVDGTVAVSGSVDSWGDREAVVGAVSGTFGVRAIDTAGLRVM